MAKLKPYLYLIQEKKSSWHFCMLGKHKVTIHWEQFPFHACWYNLSFGYTYYKGGPERDNKFIQHLIAKRIPFTHEPNGISPRISIDWSRVKIRPYRKGKWSTGRSYSIGNPEIQTIKP